MSIRVGSTRYTGTVQADGGFLGDTLIEKTTDAGVTVEGVLIKDGLVDGRDVSADGILLDATVPLLWGTFLESFDALVTSDGATITMTLEQSGGGDLTMKFSDGQTLLDCTPALTTPLTPGTDEAPKKQYVYILQSDKILTVSDSSWPSAEHIKVALLFLPSASLVNTGASGNNFLWINHNINDPSAQTSGDGVGQGHLSHIAERIRLEPAKWLSGCEGVATQDGNDLWLSIAAGVVFQMHPHIFDALDSDTAGAGDTIGVTNDPDAAYTLINSLNEITKLSDGTAIGNNKFVKFVLTGVANKTGAIEHMLLRLPSGQYNTAAAAEVDVQGFADFSSPREFLLDASVGFLVASFVCQHTASAMLIVTTTDQRGKTPATATNAGTGGGDVTAAAALGDNLIIAGDGGAKGVQGRTASIADTGVMSVPGIGDGGITSFDLKVGDTDGLTYGMIQMGDACIGRTSFTAGDIDLDGAIICQNKGGPETGDIEFIWTESTGGTARFVLPKSGVGLATYNSRSMLLAGPAPADTDFVKVSYWQGQGIFDNLACDTASEGADLGVQNDLEVEGVIYADNLAESTAAAGITADSVVLKDGQVGLVDTDASHHLLLDAGSDLTADRLLSFVTGNADRVVTLSGSPTLSDWFDQSVKIAATPTFAGVRLADNNSIGFGTDVDATILHDGTNLLVNPKAVGVGAVRFDTDSKLEFRAASAYVYSPSAGVMQFGTSGIGPRHEFYVSATEVMRCSATGMVFNEGGSVNIDTRMESDNKDYLFFLDAGNDSVGINESAPGTTAYLTVTSDATDRIAALFQRDVAGGSVPVVKILQNRLVNPAPCLEIQQDDVSEGFINFVGTDAGVVNTDTGPSTGSFRIEMNGVVRQVPFF